MLGDKEITKLAKRMGFKIIKKPFLSYYDKLGFSVSKEEIENLHEEYKKINSEIL